jgi:hypothetical protein
MSVRTVAVVYQIKPEHIIDRLIEEPERRHRIARVGVLL